ncbi:MAG: ATP-binding cassette domain-containing protein [Armatimonadetes bacterium]|nr:ATP-binding cassette domain-containing protein [Armatimonadota bacterium]
MALVEARDIVKHFPITAGLLHRKVGDVKAVDGVSISVEAGTTLALVGETGSGKTTLARIVVRLLPPTAGRIFFDGSEITGLNDEALRPFRRQAQIVFQNPASSLNPRHRVKEILEEPLLIHRIGTPPKRWRRVEELLETVELPPRDFVLRYSHSLSGGQRQRVAVARALALEPRFIVLDEPTAALDVSVQAKIIGLLRRLQCEMRLAYLVISHDLSLMRNFADVIAVMYLGRVVEAAPMADLFHHSAHPYTRALLSAIPTVSDEESALIPEKIVLTGEVPSPARVPSGCPFHPRCYARIEPCDRVVPDAISIAQGHSVRCILYDPAYGRGGLRGIPRAGPTEGADGVD